MTDLEQKAARGSLPLRLALRYLGGRLAATSRAADGVITGLRKRNGESQHGSEATQAESATLGWTEPGPANHEPLRRRIRRYVRSSRLIRFLRDLRARLLPEPSAEDIRLREKERQRRQLETLLLEQMNTARVRLINRMTDLGLCHVSSDERHRKIDRVRLDVGRVTPQEIVFRVTHFPPGVTIHQMVDDQICTSLSEAVGRPVTGWYTKGKEDLGVFISIALAGSDGLPDTYALGDVFKDFPSTAAPLTIPFGVRANGLPLFLDLADIYHFLVAGTTGGGKTTLLHTIVCTLINRNGPETVQLDLMDFKDQGLEFAIYEGIPHLRMGHVINNADEMNDYFVDLQKEMKRRYSILKQHGKNKISAYNRRRIKGRIPYLVVVIDELAQVVNTLGQAESDKVMNRIASQGRAAGIFLIVATQYPRSDVISTVVTSNISGRVAFYLPTQDQSRVVLQTGHAHTDISDHQRGRAIVMRGGTEYLVQTPLITEHQKRQIVASVKTGRRVVNLGLSIDPEEIIRWAITNNYNKLTFDPLFENFRTRDIPRDDLFALIQSMDGQEYDISGTLYRVVNIGGSVGRRVELVDADETPDGDVIQESPNTEDRTQDQEASE